MNKIEVKITNKIINQKFSFPTYSTIGSSGLDLRACLENKIILNSQETILIPTGIEIYIKNPHITALIVPRSGLGHNKGIVLGNLIGVIDSDYQGQIMISLWNRSKKKFYIHPYSRIAQMLFVPIIKPTFSIVKKFKKTLRNKNGFGHSGIQ
ncbi:MAG: dUTP diphosphatase [Buchnera aphidicola (Pentalonia nigronervosa)]|uniref:dUTP diphosphatase n=1 Tax=Buchnera aphidicola (Pentalonia nigronervosa) TaxID=1309793 RepID=A0A7H1AZ22_9GAMM|nr:MAG: dUTP diphosphatase [Buchnera aphidicola (Pentalonia nigronervosa)]